MEGNYKKWLNRINVKLDKGGYAGTAQDLKNDIVNLEGINHVWSPTNRTLTLFDREGNQLSQVSLVSLDNEGTDLRYNATTLSLELYNADNELLDSIPVSSFIGSVGTQLQLNSNQLQLRDSQGNILSTVSFAVSNIQGLQTALGGKLDKGTYTGSASDLKTEIDGKLNKPTTTGNTTSYPYVVGEDGNGNSARLPAGDLGKNFFNSDLSNANARNHTMNAGVTVNTLGNPHTLSGLPNKNTDIANFRKVRVQNTSGLDAVVDSKNLLTDGVISMTDAEKDAWRLAQRKTGETYSTGIPIIRNLSRLVINSNISYVQYLSLIGENLYVNPSTSILKFIRVKDVAGAIITPVEYLINTFTSYYDNTSLISFGLNFNLYPDGYYVLTVTNNGLESARSPEVLLKSNYTNTPVSTNWTYIPPTYSRTQTNDILTTNSVELTGLNALSGHQDYQKIGCVYESDFIITQEMIATNFLLEIQNSVNLGGAYAHETIPTKIQILDYNNNVVAGLDLATSRSQNEDKVNILPQNSIVTPTPAMGENGLAYLLGQKISISYKDGVLTYFSTLNQGLVFYNKTFIANWDYTLHPMGFKLRVSIGGNTWGNSTVLSKKTQITNLTTI